MHPSNEISIENLNDVCFWHKPTQENIDAMELIAQKSKELMEVILLGCPACADRSLALSEVRSARMWANASIVLQNNEIDHSRGT